MKVKIVSAKKRTYWYSSMIGSIRNVRLRKFFDVEGKFQLRGFFQVVDIEESNDGGLAFFTKGDYKIISLF